MRKPARQKLPYHAQELAVGWQAHGRLRYRKRSPPLRDLAHLAAARHRKRVREYIGCENEGVQRASISSSYLEVAKLDAL